PVISTGFDLPDHVSVERARLHYTAYGLVEASCNGRVVDDAVLVPGWTSYRHRLAVRTVDISGLLQPGRNTVSLEVADGWYRGRIGFRGQHNSYGDRSGALAQLEIVLADGTRRAIATGPDWMATDSTVVSASIYDGETVDARIEPGHPRPVEVLPLDKATLFHPSTPPVRRVERLSPVRVTDKDDGRRLIDFGHTLVRHVHLRVHRFAPGDTVTVKHAEVLDPDGELFTAPLRSAKATDTYIAA